MWEGLNDGRANATDVQRKPIEPTLVKIFTVRKKPNYYQPWDLGYQENSGGSGCVIAGHRVLTNAHVVKDQVYVQVMKVGESQRYSARVEFVGHDTELAVLNVDDTSFFKGTVAATMGELPFQRDKVAVYGFPMGGNDLSITEGVVSRIEVRQYTHSHRSLLTLQTDAAINPGNSGGPVLKNGKLVGVAFQSYTDLEKTGYAVPVPLVRRFLDDIARGPYRGVPDLGIYWQKLENPAMQKLYRVGRQTGIVITGVVLESAADGVMQEDDVLTAVADMPIANNGMVPFRKNERVLFSHTVSLHQMGEKLPVEFMRNGRKLRRTLELKPFVDLVPRPIYDARPTYLVFAGLVFTPLTFNYMDCWNWNDVNPRFRHYYDYALPSPERRQIVLVSQVLAHDVNVGYHKLHGGIVLRVNGRSIGHIRDVVEALERPQDAWHVVELDRHQLSQHSVDYFDEACTRLVLDASRTEQATQDILKRYGIPADRSSDLALARNERGRRRK